MLLAALLAVPFITGILSLMVRQKAARGLTYAGLGLNAILVILIGQEIFLKKALSSSLWLLEFKLSWVPSWAINFHLGLDSFAYWLVALTQILAFCSVYASESKSSSYFAALNWAVFGVVGLFLSADTFLFFVFWELALLPIYWILVRDEQISSKDTLRFIVLTQVSGLFLLLGVLGLAYLHQDLTGSFSFAYEALIKNPIPHAHWLFGFFLVAFLIKLPAIPFHGWMPALFSKAPASTVLLAILVKTSIFGLVRFSWSIFPGGAHFCSLPVMILGVATLIYGAMLAFSQKEPRAVVAYLTLSHAGLLLMGVFCEQYLGVLILLISSALSTSALLILFELRPEINEHFSGLWSSHPRWSVALLIMLLASMGFPIFGNFVGEWLILWSIFSQNLVLAVITSVGIILSAAYGLRLFQRLCYQENAAKNLVDLSMAEVGVFSMLTLLILALGLAPGIFADGLTFTALKNNGSDLRATREVSP